MDTPRADSSNHPAAGYTTMTDERKYVNSPPDNPAINPNLANELHNVPATSLVNRAPRADAAEGSFVPQRPKRKSFGGGVDGKGRPLFTSLEASKSKHMTDGFEDIHPPDGPLRRAFKEYINVGHGDVAIGIGGVSF